MVGGADKRLLLIFLALERKTRAIKEDRNDPETFNRIIWKGMMGNKPYPTKRNGGTPQPETKRAAKTAPSQRDDD